MTPAQITSLRAKVLLDQTAVAMMQARDTSALRDYLNAPASPAFIVWRSSVSQDEIMLNGFDWARVDNLGVGKARIWEWLFDNANKAINPSKANVRAGIDQTWAGPPADLAVRASVYVHCKRAATLAEKMTATGTGSDASPANLNIDGELSDQDVNQLTFHDDGTVWTL